MDDLERLADDMEGAGGKLGRDVDTLVRGSTLQAQALGMANAPVRTGYLRSSFTSEFEGGPGSDRITGETGPEASYSPFVHGGTSRQPPNPFLDRAVDVVEPQFYAAAERLGGQVLDG